MIRWRRGLFRLWVVLTVVWVLIVCTGGIFGLAGYPWPRTKDVLTDEEFEALGGKADILEKAALFAVIPPAGALALGADSRKRRPSQ